MIADVFGTLVVALAFVGIGRLAERIASVGESELSAPAAWLISGWSLAALVAALCATTGAGLLWPALCLCGLGIAGYLVRPLPQPLIWLGVSWLIIAPLVFIASTIPPTMFDEFAQWLPNTRFLVDHGFFPNVANPNIWSFKPSYPPAIPILGYGLHGLVGHGSDMAAKIFSVLLAASFGLVLAQCLSHRLGAGIAIAIGVSFSTVLNPFFDPRIALSAYADTPTGFVLAYLIFACWRSLDERNRPQFWPAAGASVLLVLLRETNIILVVGVAAGLVLTNQRGRKHSVMFVAPAIGAFLVWRGYVAIAEMPVAIVPRTFSEWQWDAPLVVVRSLIFERLVNNWLLGGVAAGLLVMAAAAAAFFWQVLHSLRQLLLLAGCAAALWIAFLCWSYIAVFNNDEINRAAAAWRYLSQLGPALILVCFAIAGAAMDSRASTGLVPSNSWAKCAIVIFACIVPGGLILATRAHWQIQSQYPVTSAIHEIAIALKPNIGDERLDVVHAVDALGLAIEIDYDLHRPAGASVPFQTIDQISHKGLLLDATDIERFRCPRLMRWTGHGWSDAPAPTLASVCTRSLGGR